MDTAEATYWDSSALIAAAMDPSVREKLATSRRQTTRSHALAEVFSTITGGRLGFRLGADDATDIVTDLSHHLAFVDLSPQETLDALAQAKKKGVRGGQVHDYLHAAAAIKGACTTLYTLNLRDFANLFEELEITKP